MISCKKCMICGKALREWNKSGYCSNCGSKFSQVDKTLYKFVKKKKLHQIKDLIDAILGDRK